MIRNFSIMNSLAGFVSVLALSVLLAGCGPKYPNCESDEHCEEQGEFCVDGTCRQCRETADCGKPCQECTATFSCEKKEGCCVSDLDCPGSKCWLSGETGTCSSRCDEEHPCNPGQRCVAGDCVPDVECTDNTGCGPGQRCSSGRCEAACDMGPIYFDFDEYVLSSRALDGARSLADCLNAASGAISLEGHCDERGTDEYNLALGQRRANTVKKTIGNLGVDANRIRTISFGEERPACSGQDEACWRQNRRVEATID